MEVIHVGGRDVCAYRIVQTIYTIKGGQLDVHSMRKITSKEQRLQNHECARQTGKRSHIHDEACPTTDVCIPSNLRILETIKGIL